MSIDLLKFGLTALSNTPEVFPNLWFHGHHGAAVLTGHFLCDRADLSPSTKTAIHESAVEITQRFPTLFESPDADDSPVVGVQPVLDKISEIILTLSADGHDIIFASLALKAFQQAPQLATQTRVQGVIQLLNEAQSDNPKRYYGYDNYFDENIDYGHVPQFSSITDAARYSLRQHQVVFQDQNIDGNHYFLAGNKLHDITHAQALVELEEMGYTQLARAGIEPLRKQFHLCETDRLPDAIEPFQCEEMLDPTQPEFWRRGKQNAHQLKLAYAVLGLLDNEPDEAREQIMKDVSSYWMLLD